MGVEQHLKSSWGGVKIDKTIENKHKIQKGAVCVM
jgi:hypothetical protein